MLPSRRDDYLRRGLWVLIVLAAVFPVVTVARVPTPFADTQLYASIALARQLYGVGIPTVTWNSPTAVDHIPFYGPVFYDLCALWLRVYGFTLVGFRIVSLFGTALYVLGTVLLAKQFGESRTRPLFAAALSLLAPEVSAGAGTGAMHMLAVGFQLLALASFVRAFDRRRSGRHYAVVAGIMLVLAALTTTRSYPFLFAFVVAGLMPGIFGTGRLAIRSRLAGVLLTLFAGFAIWATISHGSVGAWARYMAYIFTHEDTDVAILATATREFSFHWSAIVTPAAAVAGGLLAAYSLRQRVEGRAEGRHAALSFLLLCAWIELVTTAVVLNYTFSIGEYIALPLFSIVIAWPRFPMSRRTVVAAAAVLLALDTGYLAYRTGAAAAGWQAMDPAAPHAFFAAHVPRGSTVAGSEEPFLFQVEGNGSRYRTVSPRSWADWARWVPIVEPEATLKVRRFPVEPTGERFLIWHKVDPLPEEYECAAAHVVATFEPAPLASWTPQWIRPRLSGYSGYPPATLYRLPDACPTGYDPTRPPPGR